MTNGEQQELILLNTVLRDRFFFEQYRKEDNETLGVMVSRHSALLDKVINNYKLPKTSLPTP